MTNDEMVCELKRLSDVLRISKAALAGVIGIHHVTLNRLYTGATVRNDSLSAIEHFVRRNRGARSRSDITL